MLNLRNTRSIDIDSKNSVQVTKQWHFFVTWRERWLSTKLDEKLHIWLWPGFPRYHTYMPLSTFSRSFLSIFQGVLIRLSFHSRRKFQGEIRNPHPRAFDQWDPAILKNRQYSLTNWAEVRHWCIISNIRQHAMLPLKMKGIIIQKFYLQQFIFSRILAEIADSSRFYRLRHR